MKSIIASILLSQAIGSASLRLQSATMDADTTTQSCLNPQRECKGIFSYVPGTSDKLTLSQKPNTWNVELPFATDPSDAKGVANCHQMWKQSQATVGNQQRPRSTWDEDVLVYNKYFANASKGFFLEMGAFDGIVESNSLFYERCLGWKGLLIEGNKAKFQDLVVNRPRADKLNLVPSCASDDSTMDFITANTYTSASQANMVEEHGTEAEKNGIKQAGTTETMHCGPLHMYLKDLGIHKIDFYSLDVEGAELEVLKTFDFDAVKVGVLMVESKNRWCQEVCPKRDAVRALLKSKGATLHENEVPQSDIFTWD